MRRTDNEVMAVLNHRDGPLNKMRLLFSTWSARIEQSNVGSIETRRMEIEAVEAIQRVVLKGVARVAGFASYQDRSFELIIRNDQTFEETTLKGKLDEGQLEVVDKLLPTCVYVPVAADPQPFRRALEEIVDKLSSGGRATVTPENAFKHFGELNRELVEIREMAKNALATTAPQPLPPAEEKFVKALASGIRKLAPDLADQLRDRVTAYGEKEDQYVADLVEALNGKKK